MVPARLARVAALVAVSSAPGASGAVLLRGLEAEARPSSLVLSQAFGSSFAGTFEVEDTEGGHIIANLKEVETDLVSVEAKEETQSSQLDKQIVSLVKQRDALKLTEARRKKEISFLDTEVTRQQRKLRSKQSGAAASEATKAEAKSQAKAEAQAEAEASARAEAEAKAQAEAAAAEAKAEAAATAAAASKAEAAARAAAQAAAKKESNEASAEAEAAEAEALASGSSIAAAVTAATSSSSSSQASVAAAVSTQAKTKSHFAKGMSRADMEAKMEEEAEEQMRVEAQAKAKAKIQAEQAAKAKAEAAQRKAAEAERRKQQEKERQQDAMADEADDSFKQFMKEEDGEDQMGDTDYEDSANALAGAIGWNRHEIESKADSAVKSLTEAIGGKKVIKSLQGMMGGIR